jgi:drug/metabolite transporter (DMT)-like permease
MDLPRYLVLAATLLSTAVSAPAIRFAAAPALAIVVWRIALAWPPLAAVALGRRERWPLAAGAAAGAFLAWHWIAWSLAVQLTSIATAAVLIDTGALWAALLARPLLGERVARAQWLGLGLALAGIALVVSARHAGRHSLLGDALALSGALAFVGYSFIGRRARRAAGFSGYTATVYAAAGLAALGGALALGARLHGFDRTTWLALAALGLGPTLLGHGGLNYLLRYMGPAQLSLWMLAEPALAALAAWPLFGERLTVQAGLGVALALAGVGLGTPRSTVSEERGA